jgi:hypothetical protein
MTQTSLFSKRDLASLVPDSVPVSNDTGLTANKLAAAKFTARLDPSKKVKRYRPGAKPEWLQQQEDSEAAAAAVSMGRGHPSSVASVFDGGIGTTSRRRRGARGRRMRAAAVVVSEGVGSGSESDSSSSSSDSIGGAAAVAARRARVRASVVSDEDAAESYATARRRRGRAARLGSDSEEDAMALVAEGGGGGGSLPFGAPSLHGVAAAAAPAAAIEGGGENSESDGSWETDTSEEEEEAAAARGGAHRFKRRMVKPTFVGKSQRVTLQEQEERSRKAAAATAAHAARAAAREEESRQLVVDEIRKDYEEGDGRAEMGAALDFNKPDDRDVTDDEEAYEEWMLREMRRLGRELAEREALEAEERETLRRRAMTPSEREAEDARLEAAAEKARAAAPRGKRGFLQKYYHKGVFYMDEKSMKDGAQVKRRRDFADPVAKPDVRRRSYDEATGEDRCKKEALPKVMQVKNFGRKGQTKYTHLRDQDTSQQDHSLWSDAQRDGRMRTKYESRLAGVHGGVDAAQRRGSQKRARGDADRGGASRR